MLTLAAADTIAAGASVASQITSTVFGKELTSAGAESFKVLDQRQLAASPATIYTTPSLTTAFVKTIMVNSNDTVVRTFRFFRGGTANANAITPTFSILPGGCAIRDGLELLQPGIAYMICTAAGSLGAHISVMIVVNASFGRRVIVGGAVGAH